MVSRTGNFERGQERDTLAYTARPLVRLQVGKQLRFYLLFGGIVSPFGDPPQFEATAIEARIRAHAAIPRGIMPWNTQRDVAKWISH
jgi:hypothetical protein